MNLKSRLKILGLFLFGLLALTTTGCTKKNEGPTFWIYTSLYNHVVQELNAKLSAKFPGTTFKIYQSGSENVAAKVNTELLSGKTQADLIMTSDPFWYEDLKQKQKLLTYHSPAAADLSKNLRDADGTYATMRVPVMVIAYHQDSFTAEEAPKSFSDLTTARFKDKVAMGNPLESGTTFTAVAMISQKLGWDYFAKLRANGALAAGGNSAVLGRIETKERPVGIVLLENVIAARRKNAKIMAVFPKEGAVLIPSPVAISATTAHPELAKQVYDYLFSKEGQEIVLKGDMHAVNAEVATPEGAPIWKELLLKSMPWNQEILKLIHAEREQIKQKFSKIMLE